MKKNYGPLNNMIEVLYDYRNNAKSINNNGLAIRYQDLLNIAFNISYNRPTKQSALEDLSKMILSYTPHVYKLEAGPSWTDNLSNDYCIQEHGFLTCLKNLLDEIKTNADQIVDPVIVNKLRMNIIFA